MNSNDLSTCIIDSIRQLNITIDDDDRTIYKIRSTIESCRLPLFVRDVVIKREENNTSIDVKYIEYGVNELQTLNIYIRKV